MLINLIMSELVIALFGVPLDLIGSISHGTFVSDFSCSLKGFTHTFFGKKKLQKENIPIIFMMKFDIYNIVS